ncbi:hypothetical protein IEU95_06620 [Hoyosella rhizosphaerae]|uniref:Uncharacterized protein n=1 Tax=Hoyosella rhizosphaerae TaxID=1755582 RepID=A0A916U420_9ACTN|nr:hypothetical protein [Hoyosella rhizosphaerae]MBN4926495.1 hypothetical protein [Hoyosella rhizosphaerae]GGC58880.1 hypothetical protein GCM10011410_09170 [Hoyosella rhizosphaerae]
MSDEQIQEGPSVPSSAVSAVKEFIGAHGGSAKAVLQPIGRIGVRVTLVGSDGILGDQVVADLATAKALIAQVDNLEQSEWDRELTSVVTPAPEHARRMAGWVANS